MGTRFAVQSDLWTSTVPCTKLHTLTCHWFWILNKSRPCPKQISCKLHGLDSMESRPCTCPKPNPGHVQNKSPEIYMAWNSQDQPTWPGFHGIQAMSKTDSVQDTWAGSSAIAMSQCPGSLSQFRSSQIRDGPDSTESRPSPADSSLPGTSLRWPSDSHVPQLFLSHLSGILVARWFPHTAILV
jgi:hypothetical protein